MTLKPIDKSEVFWYVKHGGECIYYSRSYENASLLLGELILKEQGIQPLNGDYFRRKDGNVRMS